MARPRKDAQPTENGEQAEKRTYVRLSKSERAQRDLTLATKRLAKLEKAWSKVEPRFAKIQVQIEEARKDAEYARSNPHLPEGAQEAADQEAATDTDDSGGTEEIDMSGLDEFAPSQDSEQVPA